MKSKNKTRNIVYAVTLLFITLSGFGQMPIFKRYYIADIPGFAWLAEFYITHMIHYISATVLIALAAYVLFDFILKGAPLDKITASGYLKIIIIAGLILSGALMVFKNLENVHFAHITINILDLAHLGLCMLLLVASLVTLVMKKRWVK